MVDKKSDELIYIIEPSVFNQQLLGMMLYKKGHCYEFRNDVASLLDDEKKRDIGLIFIDEYLATQSMSLLDVVKDSYTNQTTLPIISIGFKNSSSACSVDGELLAPFTMDALDSILETWYRSDEVLTERQALNQESFLQLKEDVGDAFPMLIETALKDCAQFDDAVLLAITNEDYGQLAELVHAIKGSYSSLGADCLSAHCAKLEKGLLDKSVLNPKEEVEILRMYLKEVKEQLACYQ